MSDKTSLGDRMKHYEQRHNEVFLPFLPIIARLDGKAFHSFTRNLKRPYDKRLSDLMVETTVFLVQETNARCGYVQSDEISLVWLTEDWESEIFFAGKLQKMCSVLSSMCTAYFNRKLGSFLPEKATSEKTMPLFDCRVFQVPKESEAANCFIWREQDATRNSVQMAARSVYSHNECNNKNTSELQEMLWQKGINWNDYPSFFKRGTYVRRRVLERRFTKEELDDLPPKHTARTNPDLVVKRTIVAKEELPPLAKIANREGVILHGEDPVTKSEQCTK